MAVHYEGTPPVVYRNELNRKGWSEWYHIHIPFSGPHVARWVKPYDGDGYWEGSVTAIDGSPIPGWQSEVMWWEDIPVYGMVDPDPVKPTELPPELEPLAGMTVNSFKLFYAEYLQQFRDKMEKGSQILGLTPDELGYEKKKEE